MTLNKWKSRAQSRNFFLLVPSSAASGQININAMELSCLLFHDFGRLRTGLIMIMALICLVVQYLLCRPHNGWPVVGGGDHRAAEEVIKNLSPEAIKLRSVCDELRLVISGKKELTVLMLLGGGWNRRHILNLFTHLFHGNCTFWFNSANLVPDNLRPTSGDPRSSSVREIIRCYMEKRLLHALRQILKRDMKWPPHTISESSMEGVLWWENVVGVCYLLRIMTANNIQELTKGGRWRQKGFFYFNATFLRD